MKKRNLLILLFAVCGSLSSLMAQTSPVESNVFSLDTRLIFESNVFSVDTRDSYTVTFDLGAYGTRSGGGALVQTVLHGEAATAPTLDLAEGWLFGGWSASFAAVTSDLTVDAVITANTTDADEDGLSYYDEVIVHGSDPNNPDSSGDGYGDGVIVGLGLDPVDDFSGFAQLVREETQDLRIGAEIASVADGEATLQIVLEESDDLSSWSERETIDVVVPLQAGESTKFFRYAMKGSGESEFPVPGDADNFALIPAGSFTMGDSFNEGASYERPTHTVQVSGFYMGKHEVSWQLWQEVRDWAVSNGYSELSGVGSGKGNEHPVHSVSWYDVVKWCNAASERAGLEPVYYVSNGGAVYKSGTSVYIDYSKQGYRLPTEAEWEKAARGGESSQRFPWGDTISHTHANYYEYTGYSYDSGDGTGYHPSYNDGSTPYTAPVGSFTANGYGLYNMGGNVLEWCNDWYGSSYYSSSPGTDPQGPSTGSRRVLRGGGWSGRALSCRVAGRNPNFSSDSRYNSLGFRLALSE
jgi:sulfatase modifying factor 1